LSLPPSPPRVMIVLHSKTDEAVILGKDLMAEKNAA